MTRDDVPRGEAAGEPQTGPPALSASVVTALADSGLTPADYARQFWADGVWSGDGCGCADDRCIGYHHDAAADCGCFPVLLGQALADRALDTQLPAEQVEPECLPPVQDEQTWQAPDEPSAGTTAEVVEPGAELGEAGL